MEARLAESGKLADSETGLLDRFRQAMSGPSAGSWFAGSALFVVVAFAAGSWLGNYTRPVAPMAFSTGEPTSSPADAPASGTSSALVVHVVGAVKSPGVVRLKAGDRVADAIAAAGGAWTNAATDALNLAAKVEDGQKIIVPKRGTAPVAVAASTATAQPSRLSHRRSSRPVFDDGIPVVPPGVMELAPLPTPGPASQTSRAETTGKPSAETGQMVSLNSATQSQLETLPGIGPKTAQAILQYRQENGPFANVDDIINVKGIGPKKLEKMRPFLRL